MTRTSIALLLPFAAIVVAACKPAYEGDVSTICRASALSGATAQTEPSARLAIAERWIPSHLESAAGRALASKLTMADVDPAELLATESKRVGLETCPLADEYATLEHRDAQRRDLETLCGYRLDEIGGDALRTAEGRALRSRLISASPSDRAAILREQARAVGLAGCSMAGASN